MNTKAPCITYGFLHEYKGDGKKLHATGRPDIMLEIVRNEHGSAEAWIHAKLYRNPLWRVTQTFGGEFTDSEILESREVKAALLKGFGPQVCPCCGK